MSLTGVSDGVFFINSGTTNLNLGTDSTETLQVQFIVGFGATVNYASGNSTLLFTGNDARIVVQGTMSVNYGDGAQNTLIGLAPGCSNDYIDVAGGDLNYNGRGGTIDTFAVPVVVEDAGQPGGVLNIKSANGQAWGAELQVQGQVGASLGCSVYLTGTNSMIEMSQAANLVAVNDYFQGGGTLVTIDSSLCALYDRPDGSGTATISAGTVLIDSIGGTYSTLYVYGNLSFGGQLFVSVGGYKYDPNNPQPGPSDQLNVKGTITLNNPTMLVYDYPTLVNQDYWMVIWSPGNNIQGNFPAGSVTYNPDGNFSAFINNQDQSQYLVRFFG